MAYPLTYKAPTGKTLKAVIKDLETSLFWDQTNSVWVAVETAACQIPFTEGSDKGFYTGTGGITPTKGGIYEIKVIDSNDANYQVITKEIFSPKSKTVLEVVNSVQTELRLPSSATILDSMAKIILAKMNTILMVTLPDSNIFDHLKVEGSFTISSGRTIYRVSPINVDTMDRVTVLKDSDGKVIPQFDDENFKALAQGYITSAVTGKPAGWRIANRDYGFPIIEFAPAPDATYAVSFEGVKAPKELTAATDYVINPLVIKNGALMMVKLELGRDASVDAGVLGTAIDRAGSAESNTVSGDFEV